MTQPRRLDGRVALITGGGRGLGLAVARRFVAEGARVAVLDRSEVALAEAARGLGDSAICVSGDVTVPEDNERAVAATVQAWGRLDVFIGNAAIFDRFATLAELEPAGLPVAFHELFDINVLGNLLGARTALPHLQASSGCVVFTASVASLGAGRGGILYTASKHAVVGVVHALAREFAPLGVRVNAVAPGAIDTELSGLATLDQERFAVRERVAERGLPLGAIPQPDDYAGLYVTLAAESDNRALTGSILTADSGLTVGR